MLKAIYRSFATFSTISPRALIVRRRTTMSNSAKSSNLAYKGDDDRSLRLVWVDLEMTGLDEHMQTIVEFATIITDGQLNIIAEGPDLVIHQSDEVLSRMDPWCKDMFAKNGLTERIRASDISMQEAEQQILAFLEQHTDKGECPLAGNSVHADKRFIAKYMPKIVEHLHYRIVDVSTVKELTRRWYPMEFESAPKKAYTHRALDDIRESIQELKYYRQAVFKPQSK